MADVLIDPIRSTVGIDSVERTTLEVPLGGIPGGTVVVLCEPGTLECYGPEVMNRLAEHGFESLAAETTLAGGPAVVSALLRRAAERGWSPEQVGMVGLGIGGRVVLDAATQMEFGAAVSMSATEPGTVPGPLATPWLGLFGRDDPGVCPRSLAALSSALNDDSNTFSQIVSYAGAGRHFYSHGDDDGRGYAAWYDGWQRTTEWLAARVAPRLTPLALQWRARNRAEEPGIR
ncbi:hydrolase [Gordonia pseudamarae]|uniref:Hydrolase n=1 Tax=Gordonia pseudamarae TaxID=2831662 RepID=A0ABX6IGB9_9ACTN|nr:MULTISPECIES: dienelactone hydrolase family protein [Gordonia]MBD0023562.1 dienelactone hydrolase family protein [Gordonia sp. (in: high G+C Gram-positive bacteria)]QHN25999.1 hydrolase [Gordonia pseudamarae]QHN34923.1 hydrolase [Gordonia pseudamarae]